MERMIIEILMSHVLVEAEAGLGDTGVTV